MYRIHALLLPLLAVLSGCAPAPEKVGIAFSSRPDVLNSVALREKWNQILNRTHPDQSLEPVKIRRSLDPLSNQSYYYLFSRTSSASFSMAQLLDRKKRDLFVHAVLPEIVGCGCTDATPKLSDGKWICYSQEAGDSCEPVIMDSGR